MASVPLVHDNKHHVWQRGMANVVIDAQAGSGGKGKLAAWLAEHYAPDVVIANFGPNAGHTVITGSFRHVFRLLPAGALCRSARIFLGAASVIDVVLLNRELDALSESLGDDVRSRLSIHPRAVILEDSDVNSERSALTFIASTMHGVGSALARKVARASRTRLARDVELLARYTMRWQAAALLSEMVLHGGRTAMIEVSQGFDLDINHGLEYPRCTSRQISPAQALADCGLPVRALGAVNATVRPYPIRVGNLEGAHPGHSGNYASDNHEITWVEVGKRAGMGEEQFAAMLEYERTTVTGRQRRVFSFSWDRLRDFVNMCGPTNLAAMFADEIDATAHGVKAYEDLPEPVRDWRQRLINRTGIRCDLISTGRDTEEMVEC